MFRLTLQRLLLDVWYPNKPSHWTAERHFSQGSWENQWYALLTQTLNHAGIGRRERRVEGWRYAGKKNVQCQQQQKAALAYLKNPHSPQRICSDVNMQKTGPIPPTMACGRLDCGEPRTGEYRIARMNGAFQMKQWVTTMESGISTILVTQAETEMARKSHKTSLT